MSVKNGEVSYGFDSIDNFLEFWFSNNYLMTEEKEVFDRYYYSYIKSFGSYIKHQYASQVKEVMEILEENKEQRILDIGTGCGTESLWFGINGANVTSVDISEKRLSVAKRRKEILENIIKDNLKVEYKLSSILDISDDEGYDIIWMEQAFHHVEPRSTFLKSICKLLKPGGWVVVSEANAWNPLIQGSLFLKRGLNTVITKTDSSGKEFMYGNERILTPRSLTRLFESVEIKKHAVRYFRVLPNLNIDGRFFYKLEKHIPQSVIFPFTHYNYVGKKC